MTVPPRTTSNGSFGWARFVPAVLAVSTAIVLFASARFLGRLGLAEIVERRRPAIGVACLLSAATLVVAQILPWLFSMARRQARDWWRRRKGVRRLHELTRSEKNLLKQYLSRETRTLVLDPSSSATSALLLDEIIYRAVELDDKALGLAFNIQSWAWTFLKDNRHLLETSEVSSARLRTSGQGPSVASPGSAANRPVG